MPRRCTAPILRSSNYFKILHLCAAATVKTSFSVSHLVPSPVKHHAAHGVEHRCIEICGSTLVSPLQSADEMIQTQLSLACRKERLQKLWLQQRKSLRSKGQLRPQRAPRSSTRSLLRSVASLTPARIDKPARHSRTALNNCTFDILDVQCLPLMQWQSDSMERSSRPSLCCRHFCSEK